MPERRERREHLAERREHLAESLGWDASLEAALLRRSPSRDLVPTRVVRQEREWFWLDTGEEKLRARVSGRLRHHAKQATDLPVIGDWVVIEGGAAKADGSVVIVDVLPRRSSLVRRRVDGTTDAQPIAANVDVALIVVALDREPNIGLIERAVVMARVGNVEPVILLSKADLAHDPQAMTDRVRASFADLQVSSISTRTGLGTDVVSTSIGPRRTGTMIGPSGVGKSTLLNHLLGTEAMAMGAVREGDRKGRHTTTHRQLFVLPSGAILIDGPGMRELGMWGSTDALAAAFPDVWAAASRCSRRACRHEDESGCAVREALREGQLSPVRVEDYRKLLAEISETARPRKRPPIASTRRSS